MDREVLGCPLDSMASAVAESTQREAVLDNIIHVTFYTKIPILY
jgi:hypothetical protein